MPDPRSLIVDGTKAAITIGFIALLASWATREHTDRQGLAVLAVAARDPVTTGAIPAAAPAPTPVAARAPTIDQRGLAALIAGQNGAPKAKPAR